MSQPNARFSWALLAEDPELKEQRDKLAKIVQVKMMEFKVNSPDKVAICASRLMQIFDNILSKPQEQKYRKVKATNPRFSKDVLTATKQSEEFLLAAGWHTMVEQLEKYWIFDAAQDSKTWKHLQLAQQELHSAQATIQEKAQRQARELEERKNGPQKEREWLLKQLEADKVLRRDRFRPIISRPHNVATTSPSPRSNVATSAGSEQLQHDAAHQPSPS